MKTKRQRVWSQIFCYGGVPLPDHRAQAKRESSRPSPVGVGNKKGDEETQVLRGAVPLRRTTQPKAFPSSDVTALPPALEYDAGFTTTTTTTTATTTNTAPGGGGGGSAAADGGEEGYCAMQTPARPTRTLQVRSMIMLSSSSLSLSNVAAMIDANF